MIYILFHSFFTSFKKYHSFRLTNTPSQKRIVRFKKFTCVGYRMKEYESKDFD